MGLKGRPTHAAIFGNSNDVGLSIRSLTSLQVCLPSTSSSRDTSFHHQISYKTIEKHQDRWSGLVLNLQKCYCEVEHSFLTAPLLPLSRNKRRREAGFTSTMGSDPVCNLMTAYFRVGLRRSNNYSKDTCYRYFYSKSPSQQC